MGTVDENNHINFYDGKIHVADPEGNQFAKYDSKDYADHIAERVEPWSYLKFPYLKNVGWNGFTDGMDSGVYCATPSPGSMLRMGWRHPRHKRLSKNSTKHRVARK